MAAYPMPDPRVGVEVLPWVILAIQGAKVYIIYLIIRRWPLSFHLSLSVSRLLPEILEVPALGKTLSVLLRPTYKKPHDNEEDKPFP